MYDAYFKDLNVLLVMIILCCNNTRNISILFCIKDTRNGVIGYCLVNSTATLVKCYQKKLKF